MFPLHTWFHLWIARNKIMARNFIFPWCKKEMHLPSGIFHPMRWQAIFPAWTHFTFYLVKREREIWLGTWTRLVLGRNPSPRDRCTKRERRKFESKPLPNCLPFHLFDYLSGAPQCVWFNLHLSRQLELLCRILHIKLQALLFAGNPELPLALNKREKHWF